MQDGREGWFLEDLYNRWRRFGIRMSACREGERTELFSYRGVVFSGDLYNRGRPFRWIHVIGTGGARAALFCASAIELSRNGGKRGSGFWWISTLGGETFGICLPACREGVRTELSVFLLTLFNLS